MGIGIKETRWWCLKKLKLELLNDPAIPLLDTYSKEMKSIPQGDMCTSLFNAALFTIVKM